MTKLALAAASVLLILASCARDAGRIVATPPPAPVSVGQAVRRDVPVTIRAIGNVASVATVEIRSQVEGQVLRVHFAEGEEVVRGQTLFTIDPERYRIALARAEAQIARDQALLLKAEQDVARYDQLIDEGYVTREQFDGANAQASALRATIRADEAVLAAARLDLEHASIVAPITGRAGSIAVDAGNLVKANDDPALVTILATRPVRARFSVPEKYLADIRERSAHGPLAVLARAPGEAGPGHAGTLTFIDNAVDRTTGTIRLEATFPNVDQALWPGQFVEIVVHVSDQKDAVIAPTTAIQVGQQGSYVFVVGSDGTAEVRPVVVDRTIGEETVVASGLTGGETVITDGQLRVVPGGKVVVRAPAEAKPS